MVFEIGLTVGRLALIWVSKKVSSLHILMTTELTHHLDRRASCRILVLVHRYRVSFHFPSDMRKLTLPFSLELTIWFVPSIIENAVAVRVRSRLSSLG